jgi:hypothetical protein
MTEFLPFNYHIRRDTFIAHCLGIRLMVFASSVYFIPHLRRRKAIIALNLRRMNSFAF